MGQTAVAPNTRIRTRLAILSDVAAAPASPIVSGGTVTIVGGYVYHTFTTDGTLTVYSAGTIDYLLVAGGGGGGARRPGGGGGGGGLLEGSASLAVGALPIVVGAGGAGGVGGVEGTRNGSPGNNSTFNGLTATGGGYGAGGGATGPDPGGNGGCGGGGGGSNDTGTESAGGTGSQGGNGGTGDRNSTGAQASGGGGGGAGPTNGTDSTTGPGAGGAGGAGKAWNGTTYGGGGGGAGGTSSASGGAGGGGAGSTAGAGTNGTANTGGGGGGTATTGNGGNGGSGIVIVRYPLVTTNYATGGTVTSDGTQIIHTFTSGGTFALAQAGLLASDYLVVGGGGGGGAGARGGGAGGGEALSGTTNIVASQSVTIGNGGTGSPGTANGSPGADSILGTIATGTGGGYGGGAPTGATPQPGGNGGNGGGGAGGTGGGNQSGGTGDQFNGGTSATNASPGDRAGGGGGGAGQVGEAGGTDGAGRGGDGGNGVTWNTVVYGGGGGGSGGVDQGTGGTGGGGAGGTTDGVDGTANTGGGGGGGNATGGDGGSGVVIVRYSPGAFQPGHPLGFGATNVLQGWWKLDEGAGTTATDSSGNSRNGTYSGSGYTLGGAAGQDGVNYADFGNGGNSSQVSIADVSAFSVNNTPGMTWIALIKPDSVAGTTRQNIISKGAAANYEWALFANDSSAARLQYNVWDPSGNDLQNEYVNSTVTTAWQLVVASTPNASYNTRGSLYRNSSTPLSTTQGTVFNLASYANGTAAVSIGWRSDSSAGQYWQGGLAHQMIFSGQMNTTNIALLRNWFLAQGWSV